MKHKVLGSVFVLSVALGVVSVAVRTPHKPALPASSRSVEQMLSEFRINSSEMAKAMEHKESLARPLASYRVRTQEDHGAFTFKGAGFESHVSADGFRFGSKEFTIALGGPKVRQGDTSLELAPGKVTNPAHGEGQIDRGGVVEKYVFENDRAEQLFTFPKAVGSGELEIRIPVTSDVPGPVVSHDPLKEGMKEMQFLKGGLAFTDSSGATKLAYHSALALDSGGQQHMMTPRFENMEIVLTVPASFMSHAVYPVTIDPWFELAGSGSGGGISNNTSVSDRPAMVMNGGGLPYIVWSDTSAADASNPSNSDIYMAVWTGFKFIAFGPSLSPGGISANPGRSTNPSICLGAVDGFPMIAWQDDTGGFSQIFCKGFTSGGLVDYAGSGSNAPLSRYVGPSQHPSIASLTAIIPGTGLIPAVFQEVPIVAYDDLTDTSEIRVLVFYPGQVGVPAGWYQLTNGGTFTSNNKINATGDPSNGLLPLGVNEYPSLKIDGNGDPVVAWQGTSSGAYEIYLKKYTLNNLGNFFIQTGAAIGTYTLNPAGGSWVGVSGSGNLGGLSATGGLSQYPSLAVDPGTANYNVAWQETLPIGPPGTSSQIYLRRSTGGGAWLPMGVSASGTGISASTSRATSPSVAVGGNYVCVAWADDASGNPEIYARRFGINPASTQWEQIGFQGSAFPSIGTDLNAPLDGLSKTPTLSLTPSIAADFFGNPTVTWMDGSTSRFDIYLKQFAPNGPGIANGTDFNITLRQTTDDPTPPAVGTDLPVGFSTQNTFVYLSSRVFTETVLPPGSALRIEFEVQPANSGFKGTPFATALIVAPDSPGVTPGNVAVVKYTGLPDTIYKWQARTVDQIGRHSPWFEFPTSPTTGSFRIDTNPGGGGGGGGGNPTPPTFVVSTRSKGHCGLLGLEAIALLGLIRLLRRK